MKSFLVVASGQGQKSSWAALVGDGGPAIIAILRKASAPREKGIFPVPAVGSSINAFIENRPARTVPPPANAPAGTAPTVYNPSNVAYVVT